MHQIAICCCCQASILQAFALVVLTGDMGLPVHCFHASGLSTDDVATLTARLNSTAATLAKQDAVCVFNLVDECQEFLQARNAAAAEAAAAAAEADELQAAAEGFAAHGSAVAGGSLWHEMQQRLQAEAAAATEAAKELSMGSVAAAVLGSNVLGSNDLWMFDGGLFAEEGWCSSDPIGPSLQIVCGSCNCISNSAMQILALQPGHLSWRTLLQLICSC